MLAVVGLLFMRSVRQARAGAYTVDATHLQGWAVVLQPVSPGGESMLALRPPPDLILELFRQVFERAGETLARSQLPGMPILLPDEINRLVAGGMTPDAIVTAARNSGIESSPVRLQCLAYRRVSEPGGTRQLYFVLLEGQALRTLRQQLGADSDAQSAVLMVAEADGQFIRWLPLRANPDSDCLAPVASDRS